MAERHNGRADALSRNQGASDNHVPDEQLLKHMYLVNKASDMFTDELRSAQDNDVTISAANQHISLNETVAGQVRRVTRQLRIEEDILTKSGRSALPPPMRKYFYSRVSEIRTFRSSQVTGHY